MKRMCIAKLDENDINNSYSTQHTIFLLFTFFFHQVIDIFISII